ncbi:MAG: ATP-binding protein [Oscillospiraceae bacterium]|nr:ATP-binding protein [Oscillospiraceae bacterium]
MADFEAMHVIEALRSGVPSRAVGAYFSEARPGMLNRIRGKMEAVRTDGRSDGFVFRGSYGEGKTHMLNTVFNLASEENMAVSYVSLGKETPMDKPHLLYSRIIANTYLPGKKQPGFRSVLEEMTPGSGAAGELLAYAATGLETNRIYYLLKAMWGTQDEEEKELFLADLEGDFVSNPVIKKTFRRVTGKPAQFNQNFSKTKHTMDYFAFVSTMFRRVGLTGWVILFDEAELIGRLGKKARIKSYRGMQDFLQSSGRLEGVFSLFAFSTSFTEDVIDRKHEFENAEAVYADDPVSLKAVRATLNAVLNAPELASLTKEEILRVISGIQEFHGMAYDWNPQLAPETVYASTEGGGYLLRTRIRAAIELLDQLYQYGEAGPVRITELGKESFEEDDTPELPEE